jgi:hypothetical protein
MPSTHRNKHVSTGVVVRRSTPHSMASWPTQNTVPPDLPIQSLTMG